MYTYILHVQQLWSPWLLLVYIILLYTTYIVFKTTTQRQGRLPWVTSDLDQRILSLSKYGVKVMDDKKQRVYARHPLHCIANITYYEDTYGKHMLALRLAKPQQPNAAEGNELVVYECTDEVRDQDKNIDLSFYSHSHTHTHSLSLSLSGTG